MYWGIDGCRGGWIAIGLAEDGSHEADYVSSISDFWDKHGDSAKRVLIDMPIGLSSDKDGRLTEAAARQLLKRRSSSVFSVPTRGAIAYGGKHGFTSDTYVAACEINREIEGKAFAKQSWNISEKIHEVDTFLRNHPTLKTILLESHPEILFWALNKQNPMRYSKKAGLGFMERVAIIEHYQTNALEIIQKTYDVYSRYMLDDDIVDALICAVCARMGNLATVPANPKQDAYGLPMQMVYPQI